MWIPRHIENLVYRIAGQFPATLVTGARQTGKTSLLRRLFPDASYLTLDLPLNAEAARTEPEALLNLYQEPIIIDEVQYAPTLLRHLKVRIDEKRTPGRFIITGSQVFSLMEGVSESLAGRCGIIQLMSFARWELMNTGRYMDYAEYIFLGGYPEIHVGVERDLWFPSYVSTYLERDVRNILRVVDLQDFNRFLRICALRTSQVVNFTDMARDAGIAPNTARKWLDLLVTSGIIYLLEPYYGNRTKRIIKAPKLMFLDTGLAAFLTGFRTTKELVESNYMGAFWETYIFSEVFKIYASSTVRPPLYYWRTVSGHEVDLIVERSHDSIIAIEAKWKEQPDLKDTVGLKMLQLAEKGKVREKIVVARSKVGYRLPDGTRIMSPEDMISLLV